LTLQNSSGLEVSPTDVGVGYSQVLPLITQSVLSRNSLICVEQPELHLHPAMQARLGDMFIEQTLSGHNVQFLIETHSESLMLRFLRRVREQKISPEDIQVLYIDQDKTGQSHIYDLPILRNGEFGAQWPHGFFDERLEEFGF
jgi:predicted ATPase